MKKLICTLFFGLVISATGASAQLQSIHLGSTASDSGATGTATIRDTGMERKEVAIRMSGLFPGSVYSAWLANDNRNELRGLGRGEFDFTADTAGNASYAVTVSQEELEKWSLIKIFRHPDGDPTNIGNVHVVLQGRLR